VIQVMLAAVGMLSPQSFVSNVMPMQSRPAVRSDAPQMMEASSRRELLARGGAALFGFSAVQSASAKAGQFSKLDIFSVIGEPAISSPYQPGGPKPSQINSIEKGTTTYGYSKSDGPILADGFREDVDREKTAFLVSAKIIKSQGKNLENKTWWLVRDNFRGQAYNMKANMRAINSQVPDAKKADAKKAYDVFWKQINALDLACVKKEQDLAIKVYEDVLAALAKYESIIA